jgi:hypothetical protein
MQILYYQAQEQQRAGSAFQRLDNMIKATRSKLLAAALPSIHRIGEPALAGFAVVIFNLVDKGMRI